MKVHHEAPFAAASNGRIHWKVFPCARAHGLADQGYIRPAYGGTGRRRSKMKPHPLSGWGK